MKYRISKYHPLFSKHVDDWTSITDVGDKRYDLTLETYLQYEEMYIKSVLILLGENNDKVVRITDFESIGKWDDSSLKQYELDESVYELYQKDYKKEIYSDLYNGKRIFKYCELPLLIKVLLREEAWFVISVGDYKIDVGYDYYIHINSLENLIEKSKLLPRGIYIEKWNIN